MHLQLDGQGPLYDQIYRAIKALIDGGALARGDRIPGSRTLKRDLAVSRNSVLTALHMLEVEGYLETRPGAGTFVVLPETPAPEAMAQNGAASAAAAGATDSPQRVRAATRYRLSRWIGDDRPVRYDFRYGRVAFPPASWTSWAQTQSRCLRRRAWPLLGTAFAGERSLREAIRAHLRLNRGIDCDAEQILVTNGSQESIYLTMTALLCPGDRVLVEEPGYLPARAVAELTGAEVCGVPVDQEGLCTGELRGRGARLAFVTPSHQFPTGAVLSAGRRQELLVWARSAGAMIYEDDYDSEFRYDVRPLPALKSLDEDGRVLHGGSFSKTMYPGLRLGFVVVPAALVATLRELKTCTTGAQPTFMQHAMAEFIHSGEYQRHLNRARKIYAERRARLLSSLDARLSGVAEWRGSQAGVHLYLTLRQGLDAATLARAAAPAGVAVTVFPPAPGADGSSFALGYGNIDAGDIDAGVAALAAAVPV
jgi:GntR family transcriptional regulator/MocR family aminotransferase